MVIAVHGVVLEFLRQQLSDDAAVVLTPMPQPLFMRVLQPVVTAVPQPKVAKKIPVSRPAGTPDVDTTQRSPDPVEGPGADPRPEGEPTQSSDVVGVPDSGHSANVDPPVAQEPPADLSDAQADWPVDTRLSYSVKGYYRGDFYGWGQVQWQRSDGRYQVQVDMRLALLFTGTLISQGELTVNGLQPRVYEERGMGRVRRLALDGATVTLNDGSQTPQPPGVQDTASQFVELTHRFATGRQALVVGAEVPVWLARPREMMLWTYDVVALETLQLPELGEVPAFHLKPRPLANPRGVINAELWFAPSLQYLPVRIRVNLGNDNYAEMTVKRIEQGDAPVTAPR